MDPNATLSELRYLVGYAVDLIDNALPCDPTTECLLDSIATHFQSLDSWLANGGFPPEGWER